MPPPLTSNTNTTSRLPCACACSDAPLYRVPQRLGQRAVLSEGIRPMMPRTRCACAITRRRTKPVRGPPNANGARLSVCIGIRRSHVNRHTDKQAERASTLRGRHLSLNLPKCGADLCRDAQAIRCNRSCMLCDTTPEKCMAHRHRAIVHGGTLDSGGGEPRHPGGPAWWTCVQGCVPHRLFATHEPPPLHQVLDPKLNRLG